MERFQKRPYLLGTARYIQSINHLIQSRFISISFGKLRIVQFGRKFFVNSVQCTFFLLWRFS